jgi:parallel beta-helix repeat protein
MNVSCVRRWLARTAVAAAATAGFSTIGVSPALAVNVSCGQVITHNTHVSNELVNCPGDGLVIGAANIKLDLGGHLVDGVSNPAADGIDNTGGFDNVVVRHGTIQQFQQGVHLVNASGNKLRKLTVRQTFRGIELGSSDHTRIDHDTVSANFDGIHLVGSDLNRISHNDVFGNTASAIVLITGSDNNRVDHNKAHDNPSWGITSDFSASNVYDHNKLYKNDIAGIEPFHGTNIRITHNRIFGNRIGIELFSTSSSFIRKNKIRSNVVDGIHVFMASTGNLVAKNKSNRNGDDGIDVGSSGNTIRKNHADRNVDLGIFAAAGNVDGGGNTAHHNGNPAQCVGGVLLAG